MRYDENHKAETRKKVVRAAAAAVRARGPDGVSVADIMGEVGLTHGGFYAHFRSKDALLAEAVREAFSQSRKRMPLFDDGLSDEEALSAFVDRYVSATHRDHPESGCAIAALSSDVPRQGAVVRQAFDAGVKGLIGSIARRLASAPAEDREGLAGSLLAEMSGAVSLARAMSDPAVSDELLAQSRRRIKARMGLPQDLIDRTTA
ncbi:TetR/AcrR family transcriptional regulator [Phenylobacterium sp.]|uniref:TetR/AcrR family transcriptional regulator n=1 Tax=Phenylobacterium sp. TaxID=1871053 RepID=UPI0035B08212